MWLATRTPTWTSITRRSPACHHTHTLCDHPPERTTYYNWVGILLPLRTAYHYWLVHRATLQPKNRQTQRIQGRGKGGQKKAATNALLEIDSRRQQYTSNMLHVRENTVINYYSILIIVVGRKLHNQQRQKNHAIIELVSTLAITSLALTVLPTPQSHNLYTYIHTLLYYYYYSDPQPTKMAGNARTIDADDAAYCLAAYRSWLFATTQEQMRHLDQSVTTKTTTATSKTKISDQQVSSAPGGVVVVMVQSSPSSSPSSLSSLSSTRSLAYNNSSSSSEILPVSATILEQDTAPPPPPPPTTTTSTTTAGQNHLFPAT